MERFRAFVIQELNVKRLKFVEDVADIAEYTVKPNAPILGPKRGALGAAIVVALAKADTAAAAAAVNRGDSFELEVDGRTLVLSPDEVLVEKKGKHGLQLAEAEGYAAALDTVLTEDLRREGIARDLVRHLQNLRKNLGLDVEDRIHVQIDVTGPLAEAVQCHRDYIAAETLADTVVLGRLAAEGATELKLEGNSLLVRVSKVLANDA